MAHKLISHKIKKKKSSAKSLTKNHNMKPNTEKKIVLLFFNNTLLVISCSYQEGGEVIVDKLSARTEVCLCFNILSGSMCSPHEPLH